MNSAWDRAILKIMLVVLAWIAFWVFVLGALVIECSAADLAPVHVTRNRPEPLTSRLGPVLVDTVITRPAERLAAEGLTRTPWEASYRIRCPDGSAGSGTAITDHIIVTNNHVVQDGLAYGRTVRVENDLLGTRHEAYVLQHDGHYDLALLYVKPTLRYVEMSKEKPGGQLTLFGYTHAGRLMSNSRPGGVIGNYNRGDHLTYKTSIQSISGDSGGGIFDETGKLRAVNWGADPSSGECSLSVSVEWVWAELSELHTQWGCPGGSCPIPPSGGGGYACGGGYGGGGVQPKQPVAPQPVQPTAPEPDAPQPQPGSPEPAPDVVTDDDLAAAISQAVADIKLSIEAIGGVDGEAGPAGPEGPQGPAGPPGPSAEVDIDAIVAAVIQRLPQQDSQPFFIRSSPDGKYEAVYPGNHVTLDLEKMLREAQQNQ